MSEKFTPNNFAKLSNLRHIFMVYLLDCFIVPLVQWFIVGPAWIGLYSNETVKQGNLPCTDLSAGPDRQAFC